MNIDPSLFMKGAIVAFSIAAPVGPTGVLCIRRTFAFGRLSGLFSGLGAASANALYGIILVSGLTLVSKELIACQFWLRLIGGAFLFYLGYKTFKAHPTDVTKKATHKTLFTDYLSTFFLSMTNPITMIAYLAVFTSLSLDNLEKNFEGAIALILGLFCGAIAWWIILTECITFFRKKITRKVMLWINRIAGLLIASFGLLAWLSLIPL